MSCSTSLNFADGGQNDAMTQYFVELNNTQLPIFEIPNSVCLLNHYDHLLLFYESQIDTGLPPPIPLFDIVVVLMTLATVSEHYKEHTLRDNDPYNVSRSSLNKRALKILRYYTEKLKAFDVTECDLYDLELLRCQFFIVIDHLVSGNVITNPYRSYISCLEQKNDVLGNQLITLRLSDRGEFLNMILWTLSNSLEESTSLYLSSHDTWMPLLHIIIDLVELRHDFFMKNEINKTQDKSSYVESLSQSPLAKFLTSFDSTGNFDNRFCQYLFIMCKCNSNVRLKERLLVHAVFIGEERISETFVPRVRYNRDYKLTKSFNMQRRLLKACLKLLFDIPPGCGMQSPKANMKGILTHLAKNLADLTELDELKAFFFSDWRQSLHIMPSVAQRTLIEMFSNFVEATKETEVTIPQLYLAERLDDADYFLSECVSLFQNGFFLLWNPKAKKRSIVDSLKADVCLLVLVKSLQYLNGKSALIDCASYDSFVAAINKNDSDRNDVINEYYEGETPPNFHSSIVQFLDV